MTTQASLPADETVRTLETVAHDPRMLWPDTMSVAADGYVYVTANQLHRQARYHQGQDLRQKPYTLFCSRIDAQPVMRYIILSS